jgi:hypothetical protein
MTTTPASTGEMDHLDQLGAKAAGRARGPAPAAGRTGAKAMLKAIRQRWSIENSWHRVRDVPLREDANRYREDNGVQILATLRSLAINALRLEGIWSITPGRGSGWRGRRGLRLWAG